MCPGREKSLKSVESIERVGGDVLLRAHRSELYARHKSHLLAMAPVISFSTSTAMRPQRQTPSQVVVIHAFRRCGAGVCGGGRPVSSSVFRLQGAASPPPAMPSSMLSFSSACVTVKRTRASVQGSKSIVIRVWFASPSSSLERALAVAIFLGDENSIALPKMSKMSVPSER